MHSPSKTPKIKHKPVRRNGYYISYYNCVSYVQKGRIKIEHIRWRYLRYQRDLNWTSRDEGTYNNINTVEVKISTPEYIVI